MAIPQDMINSFPKRLPDSHKGDFGHLLVIAGSSGYTGAAYLASQAAIRSGSGLVTLAISESLYSILANKTTHKTMIIISLALRKSQSWTSASR